MKRATWGMVALFALAACLGSEVHERRAAGVAQSALVPLAGCSEAEASMRAAALAEMNAQLDRIKQRYLEHQGCYPPEYDSGASGGGGSTQGGASKVSGTNTQVAGVDEADFVKNDSQFIYVTANGQLRLVQAWPPDQSHVSADVPIEGVPKRLYVVGNRALVYSSLQGSTTQPQPGYPYYDQSECSYGYGCEFNGDGHPAKLTLFDITDRSAPVLVREIRLSGGYLNSRRIGPAVHTIVVAPGAQFPGLVYSPPDLPCGGTASPAEIEEAFEKLRAANTAVVESSSLEDWLPTMTDTVYTGGQPVTSGNLLGTCPNFYRSGLNDGTSLLTVVSVSIEDQAQPATTTILSRPGAAYASTEALYIAVPQQRNDWYGWYGDWGQSDEVSTIHKFGLSGVIPTYVASGVVKGRVLNQFSMDENDGYLRIATTTGQLPSDTVHSTLSVLASQGGELVTVGQIDSIAPKEDIRSVRFDGDRAFMVTFKKTDPLFAFDLTDPRAPRKIGELKIPGFSTYMHMMDPGHLLTIGYDADDQGDFAWFAGVLIQIFDVTDPTNPIQQHVFEIGTRGSSSEALTNHLAFNYFDALHLLALPMTVCEGGELGGYGTQMTFNGLMVFDVTVDGGIAEKGRVAHPNSGSSAYDNQACSNWWTNASTEVKRSVFMDDWVFSISESRIKVNRLSDLGKDVAEVSLK